MNLYVALSVVCGCTVFAIYISKKNNMALQYIVHVVFHVTSFTLFLVLQISFFRNMTATPLATKATFSRVHFSMSEAEYCSLVASSACSA